MTILTTTRRRGAPKILAGALALSLLAAACGGGDDDAADTKRKTTSAAEESTTTTSEATTTTVAGETTTTTAAPVAASKTTTPLRAAPKAAPKQSAGIINVTATPTTAPPVNIKRGGTVTFTVAADVVPGFDPIAYGSGAGHMRALYDTLIDVDIDNGDIIPRIAEGLTSTDGKVWTLKIRPNVKFHDGETLDAAAVKFNWDRIQDPKNASTAIGAFANVESTTVVSPLELRIVLKTVNGQYPRTVVGVGHIASPKAVQTKGAGFASDPVGAGPFVFKSWRRDDRTELEKFAGYWDTGKPYIDKAVIRVVPDVNQRLNGLRSGETDLAIIQDPEAFDRASKDTNLKAALTVSAIGGRFITLHNGKAPFDDLKARKAIASALNRAGFIQTVTKGLDDSAENIIRPPSPFFVADVKQTPFNPTEAQKLLDEYAAAKGGPLTFTLKPTATNQAMGEYFQAQLQQFKNLKMDVEVIPTAQINTTVATGNFQALVTQYFGPDPDLYHGTFHSTGSGNFAKFKSTKMDQALDAGRAAFDVQSRIAAYKAVQEVVRDEVPGVFVSQNKAGLVGGKYMNGIKGWSAAGYPQPNWQDLWIDK